MSINSTLRSSIENLVARKALELFDVTLGREKGKIFLRIFIDRKQGEVTIGDCESVSSAVRELLEGNDYIQDKYYLEVSSPGLNRPLRKLADFKRFAGRIVKMTLREPLDIVPLSRHIKGRIKAVQGSIVIIEQDKGKNLNIEYLSIKKSHLEVEWGGCSGSSERREVM
ncbi:MAG: ribosome maturation factor RimP [bacterium]